MQHLSIQSVPTALSSAFISFALWFSKQAQRKQSGMLTELGSPETHMQMIHLLQPDVPSS